ncbi:TonB-dependent receptor plug domain-containing protein [Desulfobacula phenolica]|nr:Plug domain-containing protein [Desulfobacula phenolica]
MRDVPSAITAFTETDLEDADIVDIKAVTDMIPNMMIDSGIGGNNNVIFRGIGSSMFTGKNPVVLYVDGVPFDQVSHYGADLVNIERVEVLRGPQGTL